MNIIAESLMVAYKSALASHEEEVKNQEAKNKAKLQEIYKVRQEAQKVCTHPTKEVVDGWDYHNNCDDSYNKCTVCGKEHIK